MGGWKKKRRSKMVRKGPKGAKKGLKGLRKVQKYHETVKIGPKIAQKNPQKCLENKLKLCKIAHCGFGCNWEEVSNVFSKTSNGSKKVKNESEKTLHR